MADVADLEAMREALLAARFAGVRTVEYEGRRICAAEPLPRHRQHDHAMSSNDRAAAHEHAGHGVLALSVMIMAAQGEAGAAVRIPQSQDCGQPADSRLFKCVSIGYAPRMVMKDAGLRIRIDRDLRDAFLEVCRAQDKPAAQIIREFMRDYVDRHRAPVLPPEQASRTRRRKAPQ